MPEHFEEWWGYGAFFFVASSAQLFYSGLILLQTRPWIIRAGLVGNAAIVLLYLTTRTVGVPLVGPHAWEVEEVGLLDVVATLAEIALIVVLAVRMRGGATRAMTEDVPPS